MPLLNQKSGDSPGQKQSPARERDHAGSVNLETKIKTGRGNDGVKDLGTPEVTRW